jgi:hypothetical protein
MRLVLHHHLIKATARIVQLVQRQARGWMASIQFSAGATVFLLHRAQIGSGASYPMGSRVPYPEVKWSGHEADHSSTSSVEVKNGEIIPPFPHTFSRPGA